MKWWSLSAIELAQTGVGARGGMRRWLPALPGVLYVVTFVVGFMMVNTPSDDESNKIWVDYFADRGHQIQVLVSGFLLVIAGMLLLTFLTRLHGRVYAARRSEDRDPLPLVAAAAAGGLVATGGIIAATVPGAMIFGNLHVPGADILRLTSDMSFPLIAVGGGFAVAVAIGRGRPAVPPDPTACETVMIMHQDRIGGFEGVLAQEPRREIL